MILQRGLKNDFFFNSNLLFPIFNWTFILPFNFVLAFGNLFGSFAKKANGPYVSNVFQYLRKSNSVKKGS